MDIKYAKLDSEDILILNELIKEEFLPKNKIDLMKDINKILFKINNKTHSRSYYHKKITKLINCGWIEEIKSKPIDYYINKNIQDKVKLFVDSYNGINEILCKDKIKSGYNELDTLKGGNTK